MAHWRAGRQSLVTVHVYVEGGGERDDLLTDCRRSFHKFFESAGLKGKLPAVKPHGGRSQTIEAFKHRLADQNRDFVPVLLVDSEELVTGPVLGSTAKDHLSNRAADNAAFIRDVPNEQVHLMMPVMETWFLADRATTVRYFGAGFQESALPPAARAAETVSKKDCMDALKHATRALAIKRPYDKGEHSFKLLGDLNGLIVRDRCRWASRLCTLMEYIITREPFKEDATTQY